MLQVLAITIGTALAVFGAFTLNDQRRLPEPAAEVIAGASLMLGAGLAIAYVGFGA